MYYSNPAPSFVCMHAYDATCICYILSTSHPVCLSSVPPYFWGRAMSVYEFVCVYMGVCSPSRCLCVGGVYVWTRLAPGCCVPLALLLINNMVPTLGGTLDDQRTLNTSGHISGILLITVITRLSYLVSPWLGWNVAQLPTLMVSMAWRQKCTHILTLIYLMWSRMSFVVGGWSLFELWPVFRRSYCQRNQRPPAQTACSIVLLFPRVHCTWGPVQ